MSLSFTTRVELSEKLNRCSCLPHFQLDSSIIFVVLLVVVFTISLTMSSNRFYGADQEAVHYINEKKTSEVAKVPNKK